jgi:hypothetical protein
MAAPPYSARFMSGRGGNRTETFICPAGRRGVVRHLSFYRWDDTGTPSTFLYVHGIPVFHVQPGGPKQFFGEVRFVVYQGEEVRVVLNGTDWSYEISGFLFADPDGTPDDADNVISTFTRPAPLPAAAAPR